MVPLGIVLLPLAVIELFLLPDACITEIREKTSNLSGFDFEMSETDCSAFGKDAAVSVFVSTAGGHEKALLFKYDPGGVGPLPSIVVSDQGNISISITQISSIFSQSRKWKNSSIDYDIAHIEYPDPVDPGKKPE